MTLIDMAERTAALQHFAYVVELAPDSDYAAQSRRFLAPSVATVLGSGNTETAQVNFELEPNRFTSPPTEPELAQSENRFRFRLESGVLYNSNVQLAPLSREIFPSGRASPQAFVAPQAELLIWTRGVWSVGSTIDAYLNVNNRDQKDYNLQSFTPGIFIEKSLTESDLAQPNVQWDGRIQYDFGYDAFAIKTFGRRHGVTTSLVRSGVDGDELTLYYRIDYSNYADDGTVPAETSLDGWTSTLGISRSHDPGIGPFERLDVGFDLQWADLEGSIYSYRGVYLFTETEISLWSRTWAELQLGWGYRDYYQYAFVPSRNENVWRAAAELHHAFDQSWSVTGVFSYDRFDSQEPFFQSDRFLTGVMVTYER